jgi:hypothetical protein
MIGNPVEHFKLPSIALVEKDWHIVNALAAILAVDTSLLFRLVSAVAPRLAGYSV